MTQKLLKEKREEALHYWFKSSESDLETAQALFKSKKYHHSLFFYHLSLEKLFKAKIVELKDKSPLPIHNLVVLLKELDFIFQEEDKKELREISSFNLNTRYDSYKFEFLKKANLDFTKKWIKIVEKWYEKVENL